MGEGQQIAPAVAGMPAPITTPAEIIQQAIASDGDLSQLEKLLEFQERYERNEARKAYHLAMSEFKANPPKIEKDKKVGYNSSRGNVAYSHASLSNVTEKINQALSKHGLSASWKTEQQDNLVSVTCRITHKQGHFEETTLRAEPDSSGSKNSIQAIGSTVTYLERYTLLALTGLATYDQDNDGQGVVEKITEEQLHTLRDLLIATDSDEGKFLKCFNLDSMETMTQHDYKRALAALEAKKKRAWKDTKK